MEELVQAHKDRRLNQFRELLEQNQNTGYFATDYADLVDEIICTDVYCTYSVDYYYAIFDFMERNFKYCEPGLFTAFQCLSNRLGYCLRTMDVLAASSYLKVYKRLHTQFMNKLIIESYEWNLDIARKSNFFWETDFTLANYNALAISVNILNELPSSQIDVTQHMLPHDMFSLLIDFALYSRWDLYAILYKLYTYSHKNLQICSIFHKSAVHIQQQWRVYKEIQRKQTIARVCYKLGFSPEIARVIADHGSDSLTRSSAT